MPVRSFESPQVSTEPGQLQRALTSTRLVIESVFANIRSQMRLEQHLARTVAGPATRIVMRILALTIGMLLNTPAHRPARALAVFDGR